MYIVKPSDLIGEIKNFPIEVVQTMVNRQATPDVTVFQKEASHLSNQGGFNWSDQPEGSSFWWDVIHSKNFEKYFSKYPKQEFNFPCIMEVSNNQDFRCSNIRVVFMQKNGRFLAWSRAETFAEAESVTDVINWKYAHIPLKKVTKAQIATMLGTTNFEIID